MAPARTSNAAGFDFTDELVRGQAVDAPARPVVYVVGDRSAPPPEFLALPAREREMWRLCRYYFLHPPGVGAVWRDTLGQPPALVYELPRASEYVAQRDALARRDLLVRNGCPDWLVDLADGTHTSAVR